MLRFRRNPVADHFGDTVAVSGGNAKASRGGWKGDKHPPGADQLTHARRDEFEEAGQIPLLEDAEREFVERLELTDPS